MGISQGCTLSTFFVVALYTRWCRHLESLKGVSVDTLECNFYDVDTLLTAVQYTSRSARERMTAWRYESVGCELSNLMFVICAGILM